MDTLGIEQAMKQCWVACAKFHARGLSISSGSVEAGGETLVTFEGFDRL